MEHIRSSNDASNVGLEWPRNEQCPFLITLHMDSRLTSDIGLVLGVNAKKQHCNYNI